MVILDNHHGEPVARTVSLNTREITFDQVGTGTEVTVRMAIVVAHLDGDYLISNILETSINQSLTEPAFTTGWQRVTATADADATAAGFQFTTEAVAGTMYYIGHNENFGNYRTTDADFVTVPATPRLRIGLAHSANETNGERDDVDFEACVIRIDDEGGDRVFPHDVTTVASSYGTTAWDHDNQASTTALSVPHKLFLYDLSSALTFNPGPTPAQGTLGTGGYALVNVRVHDDGDITVPMHASSAVAANRDGTLEPDNLPLTMVKVGWFGSGTALAVGDVFAEPPDEHRDLPNDIFESDVTYTITAWAVNDDDETIVVTIDAAGCQKAIVQELRTAGADYVLALKRNQRTLHAKVRAAFEEADRGAFTPEVQDRCETVERNGGRRERRTCTVLGGPDLCARVADPAAWPGLCRLIRVQTERRHSRKRQCSVRHCISSRPGDAAALLELVRGHWRVPSGRGNGLHRTLAVQFREDDCRLRTGPP